MSLLNYTSPDGLKLDLDLKKWSVSGQPLASTNATSISYVPLDQRVRKWPFRIQGGWVNLKQIAINFELFFEELCSYNERDLVVVTSARDSGHSPNSKHYRGLALDLTFRGGGHYIFLKAIQRPDLLKKYNLRIMGPNHGSNYHTHIEVNSTDPVSYVDYTSYNGTGQLSDSENYNKNDEAIRQQGGWWPNEAGKGYEPINSIEMGREYAAATSNGRSSIVFSDHLTKNELVKDLSNREELISFIRTDKSTIPDNPPPKLVAVTESNMELDTITVHRLD